jgi:hypothetical protein
MLSAFRAFSGHGSFAVLRLCGSVAAFAIIARAVRALRSRV